MRVIPRSRFGRFAAVAVVLAGATVAFFQLRPPPLPDDRYRGSYVFEDGSYVAVMPRPGGTHGLTVPTTGEVRTLVAGDATDVLVTEVSPGHGAEPLRLEFERGSNGRVSGVRLVRGSDRPLRAERLALREEILEFQSGELALRAKLVLPPGPGSLPAVVVVHGSGRRSAVDYMSLPYLLAPGGVATLLFDKRGTGGSEGTFTMDFDLLAADVAAAVRSLRGRTEVDPERVHLLGLSQGGWVAPLAATLADGLRSVVVAYGPAVPVWREDRWGYEYRIRERGFGDEEVRKADEINDVLMAIVDRGENRWSELGATLDRYRDEPWFDAVKGSDSILGFLAGNPLPSFVIRGYYAVAGKTYGLDRSYDPGPVLRRLDLPMLWLLGGEDSSMPTPESVRVLESLREELEKPYEIVVFPDAEHEIRRFEERDGRRRILGYVPGYFERIVEWVRAGAVPG